MKTKQILATFAWLTAIMMAVTLTSCTKEDNPTGHKPFFNDGDATLVSNDEELRSAIADRANILLACDIQLSNSTLSIPEGTKVTINLGGFTLDRGLTKRGKDGGQVITIREGATLHLSNGTLKGGWGGDSGGINNEGGTANLTDVTITGCTGDDKGGGICNRSGGTLTMKGGSISGNISNDHTTPEGGGGIFNAEGATMALTNVAITGNEAKVKGGGGICNYGTMTIDGCTIQDNIAGMNGGGIWNGKDASLSINGGNISGNTAGEQGGGIYTHSNFSMQGAVNITGNNNIRYQADNLYLNNDAVLTVIGDIAGSQIGIMQDADKTFTSGYSSYCSAEPSEIFSPDLVGMNISLQDNEAKISVADPDVIYYNVCSWEPGVGVVVTAKTLQPGEYTLMKNNSDPNLNLTDNFYVVKGNVTVNNLDIRPTTGNAVHIILCNGATLNFEEHASVNVRNFNTLYIHDQPCVSSNMGKWRMDKDGRGGGIGYYNGSHPTPGSVEIHGGDIRIDASRVDGAPAIGTYSSSTGINDKFIFYNGKIYAQGGSGAAGIGGGTASNYAGDITIYGGTIEAIGGPDKNDSYSGAGIGGGNYTEQGDVTIYGGHIIARGGHEAAGIGTSQNADYNAMNITIHDGYVEAHGDNYAAGIGGGDGIDGGTVTINGGHVEAYAGVDAAGIGGGEGGEGGTLTINGGYVYAKGNDNGAGIGGGEDGSGAQVVINGGTVIALTTGEDSPAIGGGNGGYNKGGLSIGDNLMVSSERMAIAEERQGMCWYRRQARIEPCTHPGYTAETCPYHKH